MCCPQELTKGEKVVLHLIQCTRQPGRLRILGNAYALRYLHSQKKKVKIPNSEFDMPSKSSLEICRTCPEGALYA
jgi:hypothetical protein